MSWTEAKQAFEKSRPGFKARVSQDLLAKQMADTIVAGRAGFLEAPTGTGKSFPLLVSLADVATSSGQTVLAATATKALQDQYLRDLAEIRDNYEPDLRFAVLKGRSNYVCRAKVNKDFDEVLHNVSLDDILGQSEDQDINGDVDRLDAEISPRARQALTISSSECPGKNNCKFGSTCFAERAKAKAAEAHIVVVNHAMLATDAVLQESFGFGMLPNYTLVGVDEAHELAEYVAGALSTEITERAINNLVTDVCQFIEEQHLIPDGGVIVAKLYARLRNICTGSSEKQVALTPNMFADLVELTQLIKFLNDLAAKAAEKPAHGDDEVLFKKRLRNRLGNQIRNLTTMVVADFADLLRSVELDEFTDRRTGVTRGRGVILKAEPIKIAEFMKAAMWDRGIKPLMVSATLSTGPGKAGFDYMAKEVGLDLTGEPYDTFQCDTPFDYATQAMTYIGGDIPNPRQSAHAHRAGVNVAITQLIEASQGRALSLFTSLRGLNDSYEACAPAISRMGYRVLKQNDMPTKKLADAFRDDKHSVLFATKSFFTGVDVQGESLSLLTLDKLPFHVPTLVWRARQEALDASLAHLPRFGNHGQNQRDLGSFSTMSLPDMIITLLQAYGRLIRSVSDTGLVAILDAALAPGGPQYGGKVRDALPPAPIVFNLKEAVAFAKTIPVSPDLALPTLGESADEGDLVEVTQ